MDDHKKLLIVDDDEINRDLLAFMFARDNIDLIEAVNGAEAWDIICGRKDEIMAVLLDLNMPVMDGYEFLTRMNDGGLIKEIPVFIITAEDDENTLMRCFNMGAIDIITKPFSATLIHRRLFNNIELFMLRNILEEKVREQTKEIMRKQWQLEQMNRYIMEALSTVIEFRDLESGEHVHRIRDVTRVF
jgi:putative two-component system response regulator